LVNVFDATSPHSVRRFPSRDRSIARQRSDGPLLVPHLMVAAWIVGGREIEYVRFSVERIEFDSRR